MLSTVKKIGPVLELFTPERPEWRMTEIARELGMPKSSAHSLVCTLNEIGLLSISPQGRYRLGWNLLTLSERMRAGLDFSRHARPAMEELSSELRETVLLAALDRHQVIYVERVEGNHPMVRLAGVKVGSRAPAHCTAAGKVLLADREPSEVEAAFADTPLKRYTAKTLTTIEDLQRELFEVRNRGLAYDIGEIVADVACISAPIRDKHGAVVAAMSVSVPAYRFERNRRQLIEPLKRAAVKVSTALSRTVVPDVPVPDSPADAPDAVAL